MIHTKSTARLAVLFGIVVLLLGVISWRVFDLSYRRHTWYQEASAAQTSGTANVLVRGALELRAQDGTSVVVATNKKFPIVVANTTRIDQGAIAKTASVLSGLTSIEASVLENQLRQSGSRVLARRLSEQQVTKIQDLRIPGISVGYETDRSYPAGTLAADVVGFLGYGQSGREGQYGVEGFYDTDLSGAASSEDTTGTPVTTVKRWFGRGDQAPAPSTRRPKDLVLSIDKTVQAYAQEVLADVVKQREAVSGVLIVQEPQTGRIVAMADVPTFDPNTYRDAPISSFINSGLQAFEPGSAMKSFTMAAGLEARAITPETTFNDEGNTTIDGYTIKNFNEQNFGIVTMTQVLEKSLNTGVMWVQQKIGNQVFRDMLVALGFGQRTQIDLAGEASGDIGNLYAGRRINFLTASFGQGITVTPIQMITAYSAIANGGKLMRPSVVDAIIDDHGNETPRQPQLVGTPFSAKTALQLQRMLTSVVDKGFDKARIARYDIAGKTGTAQIADPSEGGYLEGEYNHSFVGFAPSYNAKFVILIKIERPKGVTFAADSLSPVFRTMASFLLSYYNIPPTR